MKRHSMTVRMLAVLLTLALLTACGGGGGAAGAGGGTITLRVGSGHADTNPWIIAFEEHFVQVVGDRVANETDYNIEWVRAYGGSIITLNNELEGVEAGLVDIGAIIIVFEASRIPLQTMWYIMPFTFPDPAIGAAVYAQILEEFPEYKLSYERFNQYYLGMVFSDPYGLFSTFPVRALADVAGTRIGAAGVNISWIEGSGAAGVMTSVPEGYQNIATNVVDMVILPTRSCLNLQVHEVAPYYLDAGFGAKPFTAVTINKQSYHNLPPEVQRILREVGAELLDNTTEFMTALHQESLEYMRAQGVTVYHLDRREQEAWAASLGNIVRDDLVPMLNNAGYDGAVVVERVLELAEEQGVPRVRDWINE